MDKTCLKEILSELCVDFVLNKFEMERPEEFVAIVQGKLKLDDGYDSACLRWINKFSSSTKTNWISKKRFGNPKKYQFRKIFACQHSNINKIKSNRTENCRIRNKNCHATIDFKFKKINRHTIKNDFLLKDGKNAIIKITFSHTHRIYVADALSYLRVDMETENLFYSYFNNYMTAASARVYHELNILNSDSAMNSIKTLANAQMNPTLRQVNYLYSKWRDSEYGTRQEEDVVNVLKCKKDIYESKGITIIVKENPMIVVIITPIMRRTFFEEFSNNMVFIDSSGSCDQTNTSVTFIFTPHKIGALPLACILHTQQTEANYTMVFSTVKESLQTNGKEFNPKIIMTDDSSAERNALRAVFPKARLLLYIFHVCQALWRWLWQTSHLVKKVDTKEIMLMFRRVLYASTSHEAEEMFTYFCTSEKVRENKYFLDHFEKLWRRRLEWCLSYRDDILTRGHHTNNFSEASIRIFKELVLPRCKVFNACALVEFIGNTFENYYQQRLLQCANSRNTALKINFLHFCSKTRNLDGSKIHKINENTYHVQSATNERILYTVHVDLVVCTCPEGRSGRFCKHLCAIELNLGLAFRTSPALTPSDRRNLVYLATGDNTIENDFFSGMDFLATQNVPKHAENGDSVTTEIDMNVEEGLQIIAQGEINTNVEEGLQIITQGEINTNVNYQLSTEIKCEFGRIIDLINVSGDETTATSLKKIRNVLKKINTPNQALTFLREKIHASSRSRTIKVQPTAVSRRVERGLQKTRRNIQAGRPSMRKKKHI